MSERRVRVVDCEGLPGDLSGALKKRSRALKHAFRTVESEPLSKDSISGIRVDFLAWGRHRARLELWDDRWVWFDARKPAARGWAWSWTREGWLSDHRTAVDLIDAVKRMPYPLDGEAPDEFALSAVWNELLKPQSA